MAVGMLDVHVDLARALLGGMFYMNGTMDAPGQESWVLALVTETFPPFEDT